MSSIDIININHNNNSINIAYFEENPFHTEIIGTFIEFFIKFNINFTIFNTYDPSKYIEFFSKFSNTSLSIKNSNSLFNIINTFHFIIIGTSYNTNNLKNIIKNFDNSKIIHIAHLNIAIKNSQKTIVLTPLNITPLTKFILPIHNIYNITHPNKHNNIIAIIGSFENRDYNQLHTLLKYNIHIHLFSRFKKDSHIDLLSKQFNNLSLFFDKNTIEIEELFKNVKYIWCSVKDNGCYFKDRLTGLIPLSFNFNIPLIINKKLNDIYNLKSTITYNNISDIPNIINNINNNQYNDIINNLICEKNIIINNNHSLFKNIFQIS